MKNVQPLLFFYELIHKWHYPNQITLFNMKETDRYGAMFETVHVGDLIHKDCPYEMYLTTANKTGAFGFLIEEKSTRTPVLIAGMQHYGQVAIIWPDWMYIPMDANRLVFDDKEKTTERLDVYDMGEDEHFQLMMMRDIPDYDVIKKAKEVYEYLSPIGKRHRIGFSVDYDQLDLDLGNLVLSEHAMNIISERFGNALEFYYEAEEHGNPLSHYVIS